MRGVLLGWSIGTKLGSWGGSYEDYGRRERSQSAQDTSILSQLAQDKQPREEGTHQLREKFQGHWDRWWSYQQNEGPPC